MPDAIESAYDGLRTTTYVVTEMNAATLYAISSTRRPSSVSMSQVSAARIAKMLEVSARVRGTAA